MNRHVKHHRLAAKESSICRESDSYDFEDSFTIELMRTDVESWEPVAAFLQSPPKWVIRLVDLRNSIVRLFGLKVGIENVDIAPPFKSGQSFGAVHLYAIDKNEAVIGENDRHLNFKVSFLLRAENKPELVLSTVVSINNKLGHLYMFFVKPAHRIIVPAMLKRMVRDIDNRALIQHRNRKNNDAFK